MKKYVINVYHEYVERVAVEAENAEDAKDKAIEMSLGINGDEFEYVDTTDAEVKSVDGVPTYGADEP